MSLKRIVITGIVLTVLISACQKKNYNERPFPRVLTKPVTEIGLKGARFHGEVIRWGGGDVTDHGFYWSLTKSFSTVFMQHISLGPLEGSSDFDAFVDFALPEGRKIYVWAYLQTGDVTVYGNPAAFTSKGCNPPEITSVEPQPATYLDEIRIHGKYFGTNEAMVSIRMDADVPLTFFSDTLIKFEVPLFLSHQYNDLVLNIMGEKMTHPFEIFPPRIDRLSKRVVVRNDTLEIYGEYFKPHLLYQMVKMDGHVCKRVEAQHDHIRIIVPWDLDTARYYRVQAIIGDMVAESRDSVFVPH